MAGGKDKSRLGGISIVGGWGGGGGGGRKGENI